MGNISVLNIGTSLAVKAYSLKGNVACGKTGTRDIDLTISYKKNIPTYMYSNVYNLRNSLSHEGRHIQQSLFLYHAFGSKGVNLSEVYGNGLIEDKQSFKDGMEVNAYNFELTHTSYSETTEKYQKYMENDHPYKKLKDNNKGLNWDALLKYVKTKYRK